VARDDRAVLLTWARAVGEFGASVTLAGATAMKTETLPIAISLSFATADVEKAAAVVLVLVESRPPPFCP